MPGRAVNFPFGCLFCLIWLVSCLVERLLRCKPLEELHDISTELFWLSARVFFLDRYAEPVENLTVFKEVTVAHGWALERVPKDFWEVCVVIRGVVKSFPKYKTQSYITDFSLISTPFQLLKIYHLIVSHQRLQSIEVCMSRTCMLKLHFWECSELMRSLFYESLWHIWIIHSW